MADKLKCRKDNALTCKLTKEQEKASFVKVDASTLKAAVICVKDADTNEKKLACKSNLPDVKVFEQQETTAIEETGTAYTTCVSQNKLAKKQKV